MIMRTGLEQITEERVKQIAKYGYTAFHDSGYKNRELLKAALTYLKLAMDPSYRPVDWPFELQYFRDEGYVESLKKAGAFIAAELDRLNVK